VLQDDRLAEFPDRRLHLLVNRGNACFDDNQLDEASDTYGQALALAIRRQDWHVEARLLGRLGAVQAELGHLDTAVSYAQQALEKAERVEDERLVGEQYSMLALANRDLGNRSEAVAYCRKAIDTFGAANAHSLQEKTRRLLDELLWEPAS
jgi:tetratricopeptide (TPR) repeat protein